MRYILEVDINDDWVAGGWEPNQDMLDKYLVPHQAALSASVQKINQFPN
jgi:hypothetical protein